MRIVWNVILYRYIILSAFATRLVVRNLPIASICARTDATFDAIIDPLCLRLHSLPPQQQLSPLPSKRPIHLQHPAHLPKRTRHPSPPRPRIAFWLSLLQVLSDKATNQVQSMMGKCKPRWRRLQFRFHVPLNHHSPPPSTTSSSISAASGDANSVPIAQEGAISASYHIIPLSSKGLESCKAHRDDVFPRKS